MVYRALSCPGDIQATIMKLSYPCNTEQVLVAARKKPRSIQQSFEEALGVQHRTQGILLEMHADFRHWDFNEALLTRGLGTPKLSVDTPCHLYDPV